jgi:histidinol-phosphatase (PHP family)
MIDYHVHTDYTFDAAGKVEDYCKSADQKKIDEICFTNHFIIIALKEHRGSIKPEEIGKHFSDIEEARKNFNVRIKVGLEVDYWNDRHKEIEKVLDSYPFDFLLGTVHFIDHFPVSGTKELAMEFFKNKSLVEIYEAYFRRAIETVESGLFDVLAHPDYIRKNIFRCFQKELPFEKYRQIAEKVVDSLVDNKVGVEINCSGYYHGLNDVFPTSDFLKLCVEKGVKVITIGSDSHLPEAICRNFNEGIEKLKNQGCKKVFSFEKRKARGIDIKSL